MLRQSWAQAVTARAGAEIAARKTRAEGAHRAKGSIVIRGEEREASGLTARFVLSTPAPVMPTLFGTPEHG